MGEWRGSEWVGFDTILRCERCNTQIGLATDESANDPNPNVTRLCWDCAGEQVVDGAEALLKDDADSPE